MRKVTLHRSLIGQGPLILVNRKHALCGTGNAELSTYDAEYPDIYLERRAARLLSACIAEIHGGGKIVPVSGWRSHADFKKRS